MLIKIKNLPTWKTRPVTPELVKRRATVQLYARYRRARSVYQRCVAEQGMEHIATRTADGAQIEAWNSLQGMQEVLWT